ncbi:MAG: CAP domain-containing protein [bacterium]
MPSRPFFFLCILAILIGTVYVASRDYPSGTPPQLLLQSLVGKDVIAPPPLRGDLDQAGNSLLVQGILAETNRHRAASNLPSLKGNSVLNQAAQKKLNDMFELGYFDHVNPAGVGPADLVEEAGYSYLRVGENLALGGFAGDAGLVQAWMDSPGHRENIMSAGFSELGIAVGQGKFEEKDSWLAVQTFALPLAACPGVNAAQQATLEQKQSQLEKLPAELDNLKSQYTTLTTASQAKINQGNELIEQGNQLAQEQKSNEEAQKLWDEGHQLQEEGQALINQAQTIRDTYNEKVSLLNQLNNEIKTLISQLNTQIKAYNNCLSGYNK